MNDQEEFNSLGIGVENVGHFLLRVRRQVAEPMNDDPNGKQIHEMDELSIWTISQQNFVNL